jgi:hypothetical protein
MSTDLAPTTDAGAALTLFGDPRPAVIVARATAIADVIAPLIRERHLTKRIHNSEHVYLEGWTLAGTMLGVFAVTVDSGPLWDADGNEVGYQATVEARTMAGAVVGRADAQCTRDENDKWDKAPSFQRRSMAITRASSKALRMPLGFVMKLAGYDTTPAEEMEAAATRGETVTGGRDVAHGWQDKAEQDRAHEELDQLIHDLGLRDWMATWMGSKNYSVPLAKGQLRQLRRVIEREQQAAADGGAGRSAASPATSTAAGASAPPGPAAVGDRSEGTDVRKGKPHQVPSDNPPGDGEDGG